MSTIQDVAKPIGVSIPILSPTINDTRSVSKPLRAQQQAASYQPNPSQIKNT